MLPDITNTELDTIQTSDTPTMGISFLFDFTLGDFVTKDGRVQKVTDLEALKVWIGKVIRTEKRRFKIYIKDNVGDEWGVTIEDLIVGQDLPPDFIEAELQRELSDSLTKHPLISSISNFEVIKENPKVKISFQVNLIDGTSFGQEVSV